MSLDNTGNQFHDIFQIKKIYRYLLFYTVPSITGLILIVAIYILRLQVGETIYVYLPSTLSINNSTGGRIIAFSEALNNLPIRKVSIYLLTKEGKKVFSSTVPSFNEGGVDINLKLPKNIIPGYYLLQFLIETTDGRKEFKNKIKIEPYSPPSKLYLPPPPKDRPIILESKTVIDNINVEFLPEGSSLLPNFKNIVFVSTKDSYGKPVSTQICMKEGLPKSIKDSPSYIETSQFGISSFIIYPLQNIISIKVGTCNSSNFTEVFLPTCPGELILRVHKPISSQNDSHRFGVVSLKNSSQLYGDIYHNGYWYKSVSSRIVNGIGQFYLENLKPGLNFIQVYSAIPPLERGIVGRHFYIKKKDESDIEAINNIINYLYLQKELQVDTNFIINIKKQLSASLINPQLLGAFLLNYLDRGYYKLPLFIDSGKLEAMELEKLQQKTKKVVSLSFIIIGIVVIVILLFFTKDRIKAYKLQQKELQELTETSSNENEILHIYIQSGVIMVIVLTAFILLSVLIALMKWY